MTSASAALEHEIGSAAPYPGLRPFLASENDIFFGREPHTDELLGRLEKTRFLAVVGTSGSGKSSLVRAGLIPALEGGFLVSAGSHWKVAVFRPGSDGVESLAAALCDCLPQPAAGTVADMTETTLRRCSLGLVEVIRQRNLPEDLHILIVVDQFEEIFRYGAGASLAESGGPAAFVRLLLTAAQADCPVHILITMRSDFLGECARFRGLAEAVNDGLYLIPRMTRDQLRKAIKAPAESFGAKMSPLLVEELLNGVEDNPDQLPVLQHALMRTWNCWQAVGKPKTPISLEEYKAQGGVEGALSAHADEVYGSLNDVQKQICKPLFQCLTERGADGREIRRPANLREVAAVAGAGEQSVIPVIEAFRNPAVAFLTSADEPLTTDSVIDISHESLIRNWERLRTWVQEESESRKTYLRLSEAAGEWSKGRGALWRDPNLAQAIAWRDSAKPSAAWARCSENEFAGVMAFVDRSLAEQTEARASAAREGRVRKTAVGVIAVAGVAAILGGFLWTQEKKRGQEALARQLAAESALDLGQGTEIGPSVLLAIESLKLASVPTADHVLRLGMSRLPGRSELMRYDTEVRVAAWSPDSRLVAVGTEGGVTTLYDRASRKNELELRHEKPVSAIAFDRSGSYLATAGDDGKVIVAPLRDAGKAVEFRLPDQVRKIAFDPRGRTIAAACSDRKLYLLDIASRNVRALWPFKDSVSSVQFSPDGMRIAVASFDGQVAMLDPGRTTPIWTWHTQLEEAKTGSIYMVNAVSFYPDGARLAVAAAEIGVLVFDTQSGRLIWKTEQRPGAFEVAVEPDGQVVAAAWGDSTVRLLHGDTGTELTRIRHQGPIYSLAFSADSRFLATASSDGTARVRGMREKRELVRVPHGKEVNTAAFSPDGAFLLTGSNDKTVRLTPANFLELGRATQIDPAIQPRESGSDHSPKTSPDGHFLMERPSDQVLLIKTSRGDHVVSFENSIDGAFSPDGRFFAHGGWNETLSIVETGHWKTLRTIPIKGKVKAVSISRDSRHVALGATDALARVFEVSTGRETARIPHQQVSDNAAVDYVAFAHDGRYLYTGVEGAADTLFRHALRKEDLIAEACGRVGRNLTAEEWNERLPGVEYQQTCKIP